MVQPVHRSSYSRASTRYHEINIADSSDENGMSISDWEGYRNTVRTVDPRLDDHKLGQYAAARRKRGKSENE